MAADYVVDMGPAAGAQGGNIVAQGTPAELMAAPTSVTGPYLSGEKRIPCPRGATPRDGRSIRLVGARAHNLRDLTVEIPIGLMTCVTGVSGSGKSSLIVDTLLPAARAELYGAGGPDRSLRCASRGSSTSTRSSRSTRLRSAARRARTLPRTRACSALLRELYAGLPEARARGYKAGRFSFNVKGGRCEACQGDGVLRVEMHFLPDVFVTCEACQGRRYNRETLEVLYRGLSIADALNFTVTQALDLFDSIPRVRERLAALGRVGLGYIALGQPATTLSGGEAQRVKLARELARKATGRTLYVLDEPTTGLHFSDIELLNTALDGLRDAGNTIVIVEHNLDIVACSDWVIDLGPEGGERGGELVAEGTPEQICGFPASHTGTYLRSTLRAVASAPKQSARPRTKAVR